jgi:phosphate transport system protein
MERHFEQELHVLKDRLLVMGGHAETMVHLAIEGLVKREANVLEEVFAKEKIVNELHMEVDEKCLLLLALRQPIAVDLRFITAAIKINTDLERIADQAVERTSSQTSYRHASYGSHCSFNGERCLGCICKKRCGLGSVCFGPG